MIRTTYFLSGMLLSSHLLAADVVERQKVVAFGVEVIEHDAFGKALDIDGDTIAVGAPAYWQWDQGAVYLFHRDGTTWYRQAKLTASDGADGDRFGSAVALEGDTLAAAGRHNGVYVFRRDGPQWIEQQKLTPGGNALAINSGTIAVGASAAAYVFKWDGASWTQQQELSPSDGQFGKNFGSAIAIDGDTIVVGASVDTNANGSDAGAAYVFDWDGTSWSEQQKLLASDGEANDFFGEAVAIHGDTITVGATGEDTNGERAGSVYVFQRNGSTWNEKQKLSAGWDYSRFGGSLAAGAAILVIGAHTQSNANGTGAGAAYVFEWDGNSFVQSQYLTASAGSTSFPKSDNFGTSVGVSDGSIVVGAPQPYTEVDSVPYGGNGVAYVFEPEGPAWAERQMLEPDSRTPSRYFGSQVAIDGDTFVVAGDDQTHHGAVWIFQRGDDGRWTAERKLEPPEPLYEPPNGYPKADLAGSVALSGDTLVVGSPVGGAAFVYHRNGSGWAEEARLIASDADQYEYLGFGRSVAIDGNTIVVGTWAGQSVYVFRKGTSGWAEEAKLFDETGAAPAGHPVAVSGDTVVIGSLMDDNENGYWAGAALVYQWDGESWTEQAKLTASDGHDQQRFGGAVAIDGDTLVVASDPYGGARMTYVFQRASGWTEQAKLTAPGGVQFDYGRPSVSIDGDTILVGEDGLGISPIGTCHVFHRIGSRWYGGWQLIPSDGASGDSYGESVAIDGDTVVIGANGQDNDNGEKAGAVYVHSLADAGIAPLHFAQFGDGGGLFSEILLSNLDPDEAICSVTLTDDRGECITVDLNGEMVTGQHDLTVPARSVRRLRTDAAGPVTSGSGSVNADRPLAGVILFGGPMGLAGVGSSIPLDEGFVAPMERRLARGINTGIALVNLEQTPIEVDIELCDPPGNVLATSQQGLAGRGHIARYVNDFDWNPPVDLSDFLGLLTARIRSDLRSGRFAATAIQDRPGEFATLPVIPLWSGGNAALATSLPVKRAIPQNDELEHKLYFAQFGEGLGQLFSQIFLCNVGPGQVSAEISLRDDEGEPLTVDLNGADVTGKLEVSIPPSGMGVFQTDARGALISGSVTVSSDGPLGGVILFGGSAGVAGVGSSVELTSGFWAPVEANLAADVNTGIAVMNLEDEVVTLNLQLLDVDGNVLATSQLTLDPKGHRALYLNNFEWTPAMNFSDFEGLLQVNTTGRTAATVIQTRPGQFATMPVIEE